MRPGIRLTPSLASRLRRKPRQVVCSIKLEERRQAAHEHVGRLVGGGGCSRRRQPGKRLRDRYGELVRSTECRDRSSSVARLRAISASTARRNCSGCASMNRAYSARVKTPQWNQANAVHSARRPIQPSGSSAFSRWRRWTMAPLTAKSNCCSSRSVPESASSRLQGNHFVGNFLVSHEVSGRLGKCPGRRIQPPAERANVPVFSQAPSRFGCQWTVEAPGP